MTNTDRAAKRDWWNSKTGFILACVGSAVGMGNIWLFPYRMAAYGGSFLVVYLIFDVLLGFSGVVGEMSFGRAVRSGPVEAFGTACASRGENRRNLGRAIGAVPMLGWRPEVWTNSGLYSDRWPVPLAIICGLSLSLW